MKIRFHTQTGGVTLQAQQPEVNIIRVALQGFAAVCGGTQSLHTNGFDEALALPTERSARIALRTQQVLAHESGVADTVDPFAGSYFVESLTDEIELRAWELMEKVEELGGSVEALEFMQREIEESALSYHERYKSGQDIIVGVNKYVTDQVDDVDILQVDPESEQRQLARLQGLQGGPRPGRGRGEARGAARRRPRRGQPAAPDPRRARRRRLDRRGLRRDARRLRRVQGRRLLLRRPGARGRRRAPERRRPAPRASPLPADRLGPGASLRSVSLLVHVAIFSGALDGAFYRRLVGHLDIGVDDLLPAVGIPALPAVRGRAGARRPVGRTRDYARRRFLRIAPAYWLALTA